MLKTAYEVRISDWSSDVCSSDLTLCLPFPSSDKAPQPASARDSMTSLRHFLAAFMCLGLIVLAGCSSTGGSGGASRGGYYKDDGPGSDIPANIQAITDAVPRIEKHAPPNFIEPKSRVWGKSVSRR